jgi:hypothetical protein
MIGLLLVPFAERDRTDQGQGIGRVARPDYPGCVRGARRHSRAGLCLNCHRATDGHFLALLALRILVNI